MRRGKVKAYKADKGFGFIIDELDRTEHFFHISAVRGQEILAPGDLVTFEIAQDRRSGKMRAEDVRRV
jgi:CspA family cold shock protein